MRQAKTDWGELASHMCPVSCEQIHVARWGSEYDEMRMITTSFARVLRGLLAIYICISPDISRG